MSLPHLSSKASALVALAHPDAPRVFAPGEMSTWLASHGTPLPLRTLTQALQEWTAADVVRKLHPRAYLNMRARPQPAPDEAVSILRPGAQVSLHRVLGQIGVLNNPSHIITAVVPISRTRKVGAIDLDGIQFRFAALPDALFTPSSSVSSSDLVEPSAPWRATPEKALIDWLHLASTPMGSARWPMPPQHDWDLELLDNGRMERLAAWSGLQNEWTAFKDKQSAPSVRPRRRGPGC